MNARAIFFALGCGMAALASASPANAYTYTFFNGTKQNVRQIWMHTVSAFCHDVNWRGTLAPGAQVNVSSASICLVDRIEVNGGRQRWSSSTGHFGGTFLVLRDGICFSSSTDAIFSTIPGVIPGIGTIAALGLSTANIKGTCQK